MKTNLLKLISGFALLGVAATTTAQSTFNTEFTSGGALATTYINGGFSATFAGVSLSYYDSSYNILNVGAGTLSLTFSQPVTSISFDVGGLDPAGSWNDKIIFPQAPTLGMAENTSGAYAYNAVLNGTTLTGNGGGGRVTFSGLADVTSFSWTDAGTAGGSDWTFYDNFSFTTAPVPEPSTLALAGLGGLSLLLFCRRK